jgi:hypothetical protein
MRQSAADRNFGNFIGISVAISPCGRTGVKKLVRIGLVALVPPLLGSAFYTPQLTREPQAEALMDGSSSQVTSIAAHEDMSPSDVGGERDDSDGPVDLLGNEVTDAVAKYKLDATGSLYETHSPQTELPRLSSPKS